MALGYTLESNPPVRTHPPARRRVLVTGAAGRIGSVFAAHSHQRYDLRLMVRPSDPGIDAIRPFGEVVFADLCDLDALKRHCQDIDTVLHLAANPHSSATWDQLLPNNIVGTYNLFAAAKSARCRRVIFASSIHAVSGYPADAQIRSADPVNPGDLYGVSKCFGEALARYMAEQEDLSAIAIRIAAHQRPEKARQHDSLAIADSFVSDRDLKQLFHRCIDDQTLRFAIFHGLSDSRFKRLDISDARELLGYAPQDDLTAEHPALAPLRLKQTLLAHNKRERNAPSGLRNDL